MKDFPEMNKEELLEQIEWLQGLAKAAYMELVLGKNLYEDLLSHLDNAACGYTKEESIEEISTY